jgi:hypothetical protein
MKSWKVLTVVFLAVVSPSLAQETWTQKFPAQSPPPGGGSMAYDSARQQVVLLTCATVPFGDTWIWDGNAWTQKFPATSPARCGNNVVYDSLRSEVVRFGGFDGSTQFNETWVWDGTNWLQRFPASSPPLRGGRGQPTTLHVNSSSCSEGSRTVRCYWAIRGSGTEVIGHRSPQHIVLQRETDLEWLTMPPGSRSFYSVGHLVLDAVKLTLGFGMEQTGRRCLRASALLRDMAPTWPMTLPANRYYFLAELLVSVAAIKALATPGYGTEVIGRKSFRQQAPRGATVWVWRATLRTRRSFYSGATN